MKGVQAACARGIKKRQTGWRGNRQTVASRQDLFLAAGSGETNQSVCRGHRNRARLRVRPDSVHAEDVLVFHVGSPAGIRLQEVEAAVEISNPEAPAAVRGKGRDITVT